MNNLLFFPAGTKKEADDINISPYGTRTVLNLPSVSINSTTDIGSFITVRADITNLSYSDIWINQQQKEELTTENITCLELRLPCMYLRIQSTSRTASEPPAVVDFDDERTTVDLWVKQLYLDQVVAVVFSYLHYIYLR